jgi:CBS domain-containing protein
MGAQASPKLGLLRRICDAQQREEFRRACFVASDIMSGPPIAVESIRPLRETVELFPANRVRHILVMRRGKLAGIVSDRDVLRALWKQRENLTLSVGDIGTPNPQTATAKTPVETLASMMLAGHFSAVPIVDRNEQPLGIVTSTDLVWLLKLLQLANSAEPGQIQSHLRAEIERLVASRSLPPGEADELIKLAGITPSAISPAAAAS